MALLVQQIKENFIDADGNVHVIPINELAPVEKVGNSNSYWYWFYTKAFEEATGQSFDTLSGYQRATVIIVLGYE
jgi:hypothetical protein